MPIPLDVDLPHQADAQIVIDARADEPAWEGALVVEDWTTYHPSPGLEPEVHAVARMLSDDQAFYLHIQVLDPEPEAIRARLCRRDDIWGDDWAGVYLDPAGDAQRGYLLLVNPLGVQADATRLAGKDDDITWDGIWQSAGRLTDTGYEVEIRVPWSSVRHPKDMEQVGVSLLRLTSRSGERASWPERDLDISGILIQENLLNGPGELDQRSTHGLRLTPSLSWGWSDQGPNDALWGAYGAAPGLTLRYDPVPALTLIGTVNPDFSQVETDANQIAVNQRFALYYDERRPFFQEGREWFTTEFGDLVYSRSINQPRYGARATVESGGWAVAALHAMDITPADSFTEGLSWTADELGPEDDRNPALSTLVRGRRAVGRDGYVGLLYSDKTLVGGEIWNRVGGVDTRIRLSDSWVASASLQGSATTYAERERQVAPAGSLMVEHDSRRWSTGAWTWLNGQEFRAENGFITRSDLWDMGAWGTVRLYPGRGPVRLWTVAPVDLSVGFRPSDGSLRDAYWGGYVNALLANSGSATLGAETVLEVFQGTELRYGRATANYSARLSQRFGLSASGSLGTGPSYQTLEVGDRQRATAGLTLVPTRRLYLEGSGGWERLAVDGDPLYSVWIARGRMEVYATPSLWARALVDYDSYRAAWGGNVVLAWERGPGRALYLGGDLRQQETELAWQVFGKATWVVAL